MADGYGGGMWGRPNTQMMQYGMQMLQPRAPGQTMPLPQMQTLPYTGGAPGSMQTLPYFSGGPQLRAQNAGPYASDDRPQDEAPTPQGKRRLRIGNKTYVEE